MLSVDEIRRNYEHGLEVAKRFFMGTADVQQAARRIAQVLSEMGIPYLICGGLAVAAHGHLRVTLDVIQLIRANALPLDYTMTLDPFVRAKFEEQYAQLPVD